MNIPRITETIALLRSIPQERFNYPNWGNVPEENCGTVACAGGHMVLHKPFQKQGLIHSTSSLAPRFGNAYGSAALADFLDISAQEAAYIFLDLHKHLGRDVIAWAITPDQIADELQALLSKPH